MDSRATVAPILARQDGVISVEQARTLGVSLHVIRGFRERGEWVQMLPGVFRMAPARPTPDMRIRAAALWAGEPSCIGGVAAAQWWGLLDQPAATIQVVTPRNRGLRPRPGLTVLRRYLDPADRAQVRGVAVTGLALTVLQSAVHLGTGGPAPVDRALQQRVSFAKQNALVHAGWRVLRFTWFDLTEGPDDVIAQLRQALAAAA